MYQSFQRPYQKGLMAGPLLLAICFFGISIAYADEPAPPDTGDVKERAVIRDMGVFQPKTNPLMPPSPPPQAGPSGPVPIVGEGGQTILEPNYKYPWVVRMNGCGGVLIDPQWVLTAAHCVTPNIGFNGVSYSRTDPYSGLLKEDGRKSIFEQRPNPGVYLHPDYQSTDPDQKHDIALIKLATPFTIDPYIQTVGLPRAPRQANVIGTLASIDHLAPVPPGQVGIFRAPIQPSTFAPKFYIHSSSAHASLCPGDSGSGFVTVENGRAVVRGVASQGTISECKTPIGDAVFTDVFTYRDWILQTMGKNDGALVGNTRVRWSGQGTRGVIGIGCIHPYQQTMWGPINVAGVEEGAACEAGQTQTVMCNVQKIPGMTIGTTQPPITGFTMRTTMANGMSEVKALPFSKTVASFYGVLPAGATREFTCKIGTTRFETILGNVGNLPTAVMTRGVDQPQADDDEPKIEQPSPFDPPESVR